MNKQEFLNSLRAALGNELGTAATEENVKYYEEYINSEIRMGKSEKEVLALLGNPKLIARSIVDAESSRTGASGNYGQSGNYHSDRNYSDGYANNGRENNRKSAVKVHNMPLWLIVLLIVVIICVIFGAIVMFVWWLAPVIVVIWLLGFVIKMLRGKK